MRYGERYAEERMDEEERLDEEEGIRLRGRRGGGGR